MSTSKPKNAATEARHTIAVVARRTGVSQLLLRAWERRYGAVAPSRTATSRRLYSDQDVEKLSFLQMLTGAGHRIGDIAGLNLAKLQELAAELPAAAVPTTGKPSSLTAAAHLAEALRATADLDSRGLEEVLGRALLDLSKPSLRNELLVPLLTEIGLRWRDGRLRVAHEHMASALISTFLSTLNSRQSVRSGAPLLAVATPSGQLHELGALLAASVALEADWEVLYLGRDIPAEDIAAAALGRGAQAVLLSVVFPLGDQAVAAELRQLRKLVGPELPLVVGGQGALSYAAVLGEISAHLVSDQRSLVSVLAGI